MHEKFREAWKAAGYIASGLNSDFPGQNVEVTFHSRGGIEKTVCPVKDTGHVIELYCRKFPMATVYYHGDSAYGFAAELRCHCGHEKSRGCCKEGGHHRAKILVSLVAAEKEAGSPGSGR
jgi:hypothetical protein